MPIVTDPALTYPHNGFLWQGQIQGELCDCMVTWESVFVPETGFANLPPVVTTLDRYVAVSAPFTEGAAGTDPVSPGTLTLTPTAHCGGMETVLDPLILILTVDGVEVYEGQDLAINYGVEARIRCYNARGDMSFVENSPTLPREPDSLCFSPDGTMLAARWGIYAPYFRVLDTSTSVWTVIEVTPTCVTGSGIAFSPDSKIIALSGNAAPYLQLFHTTDWTTVSGAPTLTDSHAQSIAFSPDGTMLAIALDSTPSLIVYRTSDWSVISAAQAPAGNGSSVSFSRDSSMLAINVYGGIYFYNTTTWGQVHESHDLAAWAVAFSPSEDRVAIGAYGWVRIYDTTTWVEVAGLQSCQYVRKVVYSYDGTMIGFTDDCFNYVRVFRTSDWVRLNFPNLEYAHDVSHISFRF